MQNKDSESTILPGHAFATTKKRNWSRIRDIAAVLTRETNPVIFAIIMGHAGIYQIWGFKFGMLMGAIGTGAISILFEIFPYGQGSQGMMTMSLIVFFLNFTLFCIFTGFALAKYTRYPDRWVALTHNPTISLYLGCYPMGATTLISVCVDVVHSHFHFGGKSFIYVLWSFWWVVVVISLGCCWVGVHAMVVKQKHSLDTMTAMWLLPVVTLIVASSCGGVFGDVIQGFSPRHALITAAASMFLVVTGLTLAMMILTIYLARLIIHGLPVGVKVLSVFLPLGPTGQSGYAIYLLGQNFKAILPYPNAGKSTFLASGMTGEILETLCTSFAFLLWSLATMWMIYAILAIRNVVLRSRVAFKMSFWGLVFPNGVYANLSILLGNAFDSQGLRIYGSIYAIVVLIIWLSIAIRSLWALKRMIDTHPVFEEAKGIQCSAEASRTQIGTEIGGV